MIILTDYPYPKYRQLCLDAGGDFFLMKSTEFEQIVPALQQLSPLKDWTMDFKNVHRLREVLVTDAQGTTSSLMQYSSQNASHFRPRFLEVPFKDQTRARKLYLRWGGRRRTGVKIEMTAIIPMQS